MPRGGALCFLRASRVALHRRDFPSHRGGASLGGQIVGERKGGRCRPDQEQDRHEGDRLVSHLPTEGAREVPPGKGACANGRRCNIRGYWRQLRPDHEGGPVGCTKPYSASPNRAVFEPEGKEVKELLGVPP